MRAGIGYDVHRLEAGAPLVVGGVRIEEAEKGAVGWSDADALTHAVCDALLGAASLGDIGEHFPPGDEQYRGIDSQELLRRTCAMLADAGLGVANVDAMVVLEKPRLTRYKKRMAGQLAATMGVDPGCVSVKATTHEGLDAVGRGEAIAVHAVAVVHEREGRGVS